MYVKKSVILCLLLFSIHLQADDVDSGHTLTFEEAVRRTSATSPVLRMSYAAIERRSGERLQNSFPPNPIIGYSVENLYGNKDWRGWNGAESRYEFAQPIELGGKRGFRTQVATYLYYAAQADYEAAGLQVLNQLFKAFLEVVAAQEQMKLADEQKKIGEEVLHAVSNKVTSGKVSLLQQNKAEIAFAQTDIAFTKAQIDFEIAKEQLAVLWGAPCPDFDQVIFDFYTIDLPLAFNQVFPSLCTHPELLSIQYEQRAAFQAVRLEEAKQIPDLTVTLGYKTERETDRRGMILGAALPLPIYDRNQGNIQAAKAETIRIEERSTQLYLQLENRLTIAHKEVGRLYQAVDQWRKTVLKAAEQSFDFAQEGYREGKFEYLDMLDSQRTLYEVKQGYIQALLNYHQSNANIKFLTTQAN